MKPKEIKKLIELVQDSNIHQLEVSRWGRKVKIMKMPGNSGANSSSMEMITVAAPQPISQPVPSPAIPAPTPAEPKPAAVSAPSNVVEIKSPMVGTFYRSPAPDADPYVQIGDIVTPGQVLCIIEAMKLMNEIESEEKGRITEILVDNAQPVEYNQALFKIEKL
ncbi:MAG: acetyl-CoA carboxylase biotin carboxyl carrier protein [Candidatus Zhuqueibacterota bacterium]